MVKNLPANARYSGSIPGSGRFTGGGSDNPLRYFLPRKFHGQSLVGYNPWSHKELNTTEYMQRAKPKGDHIWHDSIYMKCPEQENL